MQEVSRMRIAVAQALKSSRTRQTITVEFRQDVFEYLIGDKGYREGQWRVLEKEDFLEEYFFQPTEWDSLLDSHGQGTKIYYPVKVRHYISWSPKGYIKSQNQLALTEAPRSYQEKLSVKIVKVAA